jgi:acyl-CoA reductase-like NAD-dependent aldehyde dehydrogenase
MAHSFGTGQRCTASSRIIVTQNIHDKFVEALAARVKALKVGDALAADTQMGPLASQAQLDTTLSYVDVATQQGGRRVVGGETLSLCDSRLLRGTGTHRGHAPGHAHQHGRGLRPGRLDLCA